MHNYIVFRSLFEGCTSLRDLSLAANFLRQWPASELQPVSHHLHTLDMGENSLRSLEPLTEFKKLYGLRLAGNRLRNITADSFGHKSHLKMLNVADNLLEFIDIAAFESLKHLRVCKHNKCILAISVWFDFFFLRPWGWTTTVWRTSTVFWRRKGSYNGLTSLTTICSGLTMLLFLSRWSG